jgi:hypothetical protein
MPVKYRTNDLAADGQQSPVDFSRRWCPSGARPFVTAAEPPGVLVAA